MPEHIQDMKNQYEARKSGLSTQWGAVTRCKVCTRFWLWGVKDNLDFTCPECLKCLKSFETNDNR